MKVFESKEKKKQSKIKFGVFFSRYAVDQYSRFVNYRQNFCSNELISDLYNDIYIKHIDSR